MAKKLFKPLPQPLNYPDDVYTIPTLVINYFPVRDGWIDRAVTGDVSAPLNEIRRHTKKTTN